MAVDLTKSVVDLLTCPESKRDVIVFDSKLPGFGVRVFKSGVKIFLVQYTRHGRTRRIKIGQMGIITPAEARRKALELIGAIQAGGDPVEERERQATVDAATKAEADRLAEERRRADEFTVSKLLDAWLAIKLKDRSASYKREGPQAVRRLLGSLAAVSAASISADDIQAIIDREIERAPAQTIGARACGRAAWNWAMKRGLVQQNPFAAVVIERRVKSRDRVLTDAELADVWRAASAKPYPFGPVIQLLIITLQRRSEVMGMCWDELAADFSVWTIPAARAKNRRAHVVHLPPVARAILSAVKTRDDQLSAKMQAQGIAGEGMGQIRFVFTTTGETAVSGVQKARRGLDPLADDADFEGVNERRSPTGDTAGKKRVRTDWRLHDFRRTGVSKMAELGIAPHVADRVLNHVSGAISGVAAVYQRFDFAPERKRALEVWAAHVLALADGQKPASNVVPMPGVLDRPREGVA